ncbi:MAG: hypothetical protein LBL34_05650 [Clostridiales bacterium]|jgi:niacin transporter|nr:hypothetical protein [Clostridiales bacterium]
MKNHAQFKLTLAAILTAVAIVIPMFMPKIVIPPMSFTLTSHVPIFIACFISPAVAVAVVIGSTAGFFLAGFPTVIVARAGTHLIFAVLLSMYVKRYGAPKTFVARLCVGGAVSVVHALCEAAVVQWMFFPEAADNPYYVLYILVGAGTFAHSMIDYAVSEIIYKRLRIDKKFE